MSLHTHKIHLTGTPDDEKKISAGVQQALHNSLRKIDYYLLRPEAIQRYLQPGDHQCLPGQNIDFKEILVQGSRLGFIIDQTYLTVTSNDIYDPPCILREIYHDITVYRLIDNQNCWGVRLDIPTLHCNLIMTLDELENKDSRWLIRLLYEELGGWIKNDKALKKYLLSSHFTKQPLSLHAMAGWISLMDATAINSYEILSAHKPIYITPISNRRSQIMASTECKRGAAVNPFYVPPPKTTNLFAANGSLQEWNVNIGQKCLTDPWMLTGICLALSTSLLPYADIDSAGFYLTGCGAREVMMVAGSVMGGNNEGGDALYYQPSLSEYVNAPIEIGFLQKWPQEAKVKHIKKLHNHSLICFTGSGKKVVEKALLKSHRPRPREVKGLNLEPAKLYREFANRSSGDSSTDSYVTNVSPHLPLSRQSLYFMTDSPLPAQATNQQIRIDVGDGGSLENRRYVARQALQFYGTLLYDFINNLAQENTLATQVQKYVTESLQHLESRLSRARLQIVKRFVLAAFAGEKAIEYGLLNFSPTTMENAVIACCKKWLDQPTKPISTPHETMVVAERLHASLTNPAFHFHPADNIKNPAPANCAGFIIKERKKLYYLLLSDFFNKKMKLSSRAIKRSLVDAKILIRPNNKTFTSHHWIPALQRDIHGYLIDFKNLISFLQV